MAGRPKLPPTASQSEALHCRVRPAERAALRNLAQALHQTPSRVLRRLLREALTGAPDFWDDGVNEIRASHRALNAVGRNLNQLVRAANRGDVIFSEELESVVHTLRQRVAALEAVYAHAVRQARRRTVEPLSTEII